MIAGRSGVSHGGDMQKFVFSLLALAMIAGISQAGIFRSRRATAVAVVPVKSVQQAQLVAQGNNSTAQGVALLIVSTGRFRHWGGYNGFEGIGMGATPAAAEAACCFRNRMIPRERGFAQMPNGSWVCCCRY